MRSEQQEPDSNTPWVPARLKVLVNDPQYSTVILATAVFFFMSILIHFPINNSPNYYSDFLDSFWTRMTANHLREVVVGIPYVTYMFEYPPVCGLILWLGGWGSGGNVAVFISIEFSILLFFAVLTSHFVFQFLSYLKLNFNRMLLYSVFAPSLLIYGAYNFDIIQTFFVVLSLYFFIARKKLNLSAAALGLAVATKLSPALLLPLFWQEIPKNKDRVTYSLIMGGIVAAMNLPFMLANFGIWLQGYTFLRSWGLEDSFLVWIFPQNLWNIAKDVSIGLIVVSAVGIYLYFRAKPLLVRAFMILGTFILFSYIATPQMNLDLLPLFALVPMIPLSLFYLFELSNAGIILTWFEYSNQTLPGIPQTFALIRQIYLAVIVGILGFSKKIANS
jgi:alpha-1,6-mannosyltransferase